MDNAAEASEASEAASDASAGTSASEAADVVPATLPPSPAAAGGSGGDPAFRADAPRAKPRRTRRRSVVEIGRGALAMVKGTSESPRAGGGAAGPAAIDDSEVDLDSILALSDEQLEDKLSDKVLTLLKRSTEDLDQPPPVDAIQLLVDGAGRQSSEARAVMVDYLRRRLFSASVVVRRRRSERAPLYVARGCSRSAAICTPRCLPSASVESSRCSSGTAAAMAPAVGSRQPRRPRTRTPN